MSGTVRAPRAGSGRCLLTVTPQWPPAGGGLERYAVSMAKALARQHGWRTVFAASGSPHRSVVARRCDGSTVYLLPTAFTWSNTPMHPAWPRQLSRIIRAERPDVISAHAPVPGIAESAALGASGVPLVLTYHLGTLAKGRFPFDQAAFCYERTVLRWLAQRAAHVIPVSGFVSRLHGSRLGTRTTVIPPGVDVDRFAGPAGPRPPRILFVADLTRGAAHKGLPDLLAALARVAPEHRDAELLVVGDGEARADLERTAASLGLASRVRFAGHLEGAGLAAAYRSARVLALPSHDDNIPLVVLEAMASRLAVLGTRVGAVPDLLDGGKRGILVEPRDIGGLSDGLSRLLTNAALAERLGAAGRAAVEASYTWSAQADRTQSVLHQVMTDARS